MSQGDRLGSVLQKHRERYACIVDQQVHLGANLRAVAAGLVHLKSLTKLEWLDLNRTGVTDAGLVHLKGLTKLKILLLNDTGVTDAGLVHLKGLTPLRELYLDNTSVTDSAVAELKKALPNLTVIR